ncbi:hypothetical protein ACFX2H_029809 [Malus domestica]
MLFFNCFKNKTITIITKEGDSQDKGMTLKLCASLTSPKTLVLPVKDNSMHIKSWSSEVSWEVTDFSRLTTKKKASTSTIHILNSSYHACDNSPTSFEILGDHIHSEAVTWNGTFPTIGEADFAKIY